jgi:hypothetical protein
MAVLQWLLSDTRLPVRAEAQRLTGSLTAGLVEVRRVCAKIKKHGRKPHAKIDFHRPEEKLKAVHYRRL